MYINEMADEIHRWANGTFPDRTPQDVFLKVAEELGETIRNPDDPHELADLFILLLDLAVMLNHNIEKAVIEKMAINEHRKWEVDRHTRIMRHVDG